MQKLLTEAHSFLADAVSAMPRRRSRTDRRFNLLLRLAECFLDGRNQNRVDPSIQEMLSQRIDGMALGDEDVNHHEQLGRDSVFGILAGREELEQPPDRNVEPNGKGAIATKIPFWKDALDELPVKAFLES